MRLEPPGGDPLRTLAPAASAAINAGKDSVVCDLKSAEGVALAQAFADRADVVVDGFRPGVLARLGVRPHERAIVCAISGFGPEGRHSLRAGHDVNYAGWAGMLEDTAPALPPTQIADLAAGSLMALAEILAALIERGRTGLGRRLEVSMTHGSHRLVAHRLGGELLPRLLTGGVACYGIYATADGRWLTLGALEPAFFARLCELLERPALAELQFDPEEQERLTAELAAVFAKRSLASWLELAEGEDLCIGPVATLEEAAAEFGPAAAELGPAAAEFGPAAAEGAVEPLPGADTDAWRRELGLA